MHCPKCGNDDSKVIESRDTGDSVRRRRECLACGRRYTTYERIEHPHLAVIKKDGARELFDREKLANSIRRSVGKFFKSEVEVEAVIDTVENRLYELGESEVLSQTIGEFVLDALAEKNEVAYVRFASVFHKFETLDDFVQILEQRKRNRQ